MIASRNIQHHTAAAAAACCLLTAGFIAPAQSQTLAPLTADGQSFTGYFVNFDGQEWLLIGRGRQGWEFDADGQGNINDVSQNVGTTAAFTPACYSNAIITDLLDQAGITDMANVEMRLSRASDTTGTVEFQDVRWTNFSGNGGAFTWDLDNSGGTYAVTTEFKNAPAGLPGAAIGTHTTSNTHDANHGNHASRIFTWAWGSHASQQGFAYGQSVNAGTNSPTNFLWENGSEAHSIPYTEVYIPYISNDTTPPSIGTTDPVDDSTEIFAGADLAATFDERIALTGAGTITLTDLTDGSDVRTINLPDPRVTVSDRVLTINPSSLLEFATEYEITINGLAVEDTFATPNAYGGTASGEWTFTTAAQDLTPPVINSYNPLDNATGIATRAPLIATFDDDILFGTGNITLVDVASGTDNRIIPAGDPRLSIAGNVLTIIPATDLKNLSEYAVQIEAGAIINFGGLDFAGISDTTTWSFTTRPSEDGVWTANANGNWSDIANWNSGAGPVANGPDATATLSDVITGDRTITLDSSRIIGNITAVDTNRNYSISGGNSLTLDVTSGSPVIDVTTAGRTLTINSLVTGNDGIQKDGAGTVDFNGANTLTGPTTITGGILQVDDTSKGPIATGPISISGGGRLALSGTTVSSAEPVTIGAGGGAISVNGNRNFTTTGKLSGSDTLTFFNVGGGGGRRLQFYATDNDFTGGVVIGGQSDLRFEFGNLPDSANNIVFNAPSSGSGYFQLASNAIAPMVFNSRALEVSSPGNARFYIGSLSNDYGLTVNTDLIATGAGNKDLYLSSRNGTDNAFGGNITDGSDGGTISVRHSGGSWVFSGNNTYTGKTLLGNNVGPLEFRGTQAVPTASLFEMYRTTTLRFYTDDAGVVNLGNDIDLYAIDTSTGIITQYTLDAGNNGGATTGSTIVLGSVDFTTGDQRSGRQINTIGSDGYDLQLGAINLSTAIRGTAAGGAQRFNPTTAPLEITGTIQHNTGGDSAYLNAYNFYLGGSAASNVVSGTITNAPDYPGTNPNPLNLYKAGSSDWTLSGANDYAGTTTVVQGLLNVSGSLTGTGAVNISNTGGSPGTLGGTGSVAGPVTLSGTGATDLRDGAVGTLTLGSNFAIDGLAGANTLYFDVGAAGADKIVVGGNTTMPNPGAGVISLNQLAGGPIADGVYDLIDTTGTTAPITSFSLATPSAGGKDFSLQLTGSVLQLVVSGSATGPAGLFWKGGFGNNWSNLSNWSADVDGTIAATGLPAFNTDVNFYANGAIDLTTGLVDTNVNIDELIYLAGATSNTSIGGTGLLTLEASSGTGITVADPSPDTPTHTISADIGLATSQTWDVASGGFLNVTGEISGGTSTLTKTGDGTLRLGTPNNNTHAINTYGGATIIEGGVLEVSHRTLLGEPSEPDPFGTSSGAVENLVLNPGTTLRFLVAGDFLASMNRGFTLNGSSNGDTFRIDSERDGGQGYRGVQMTNTATPGYGAADQTRTLILGGSQASSGGNIDRNNRLYATLTDNGTGAVSLVKDGIGSWALYGSSTYTGGTTVNGGSLRLGVTNALPPTGTVTLADVTGAEVSSVRENRSQNFGSLTGGGSNGGHVNLGTASLTLGDSGSATYSGILTLGGSLTKKGSGTQAIVNSSSRWGGNTTVNEGTLSLGDGVSNLSLNDFSTVSVSSGGRLDLNYLSSNPDTVLELNLGGVPQAAGTYGSTSSTATFQNDTYFSGTGVINNIGGVLTDPNAYLWDGGTADIGTNGDGIGYLVDGNWNTITRNWDVGPGAHEAFGNSFDSTAVFQRTLTGNRRVTLTSDITLGAINYFGSVNTNNWFMIGNDSEDNILNFGGAATINSSNYTFYIQAGITGSPTINFTGRPADSGSRMSLRPRTQTQNVGTVNMIRSTISPAGTILELGGSTTGNVIDDITWAPGSQLLSVQREATTAGATSTDWTITQNLNLNNGRILVAEGTLICQGTDNFLANLIQVQNGGRWVARGDWTLDDSRQDVLIQNGGILSPGSGISTLSLDWNNVGGSDGWLRFNGGSTYEWEVGPGTTDVIDIKEDVGQARLVVDSGMILRIIGSGGVPQPTDKLTVFTFANGVNMPNVTDFNTRVTIDGSLVPNWDISGATFGIDIDPMTGDGTVYLTGIDAPSPYDLWAAGIFTNPFNDQLRTDDQDGDNMRNLLEFAFGTDPTVSDASALTWTEGPPASFTYGVPAISATATAPGAGVNFKARFIRRTDHGQSGSASYVWRFSSDMTDWEDSDGGHNWVTPEDVLATQGDYQLVEVVYPFFLDSFKKARFFQVEVTAVP